MIDRSGLKVPDYGENGYTSFIDEVTAELMKVVQ